MYDVQFETRTLLEMKLFDAHEAVHTAQVHTGVRSRPLHENII